MGRGRDGVLRSEGVVGVWRRQIAGWDVDEVVLCGFVREELGKEVDVHGLFCTDLLT